MRLADLLIADAVSDARFAALEVTGVSADSRTVRPGDLFVAVRGGKADGLDFVPQALAAGAAAVMAERRPPAPLPSDIAFVKVQDTRRALALAAAALFPRQPQVIAAVTGTSGKTSVAAFTREIWISLGHPAASIPAGFTSDGCPVGLQLVTAPGTDISLLEMAVAAERHTIRVRS